MAANPGITVELPTLENEAFKAKLVTLLQTDEAPDIINSWGGGVFYEQAAAGVLRPSTTCCRRKPRTQWAAPVVAAYTAPDGHLYGIARDVSEVVLWYNKDLFAQAGVDPASLATWEGFLAGVQKLKDAGITPLAAGRQGQVARSLLVEQARRASGRSGRLQRRRCAVKATALPARTSSRQASTSFSSLQLEPFQDGFQAATYGDASGYFGDGKAAMHLMGDWDYSVAKDSSANKAGIPDDKLGILPFPTIEGGKGDPTDTLGGLGGVLFTKTASDEAVRFVEYLNSKEVQARFAEGNFYIPITKGAADGMTNPFKVQIAKNIGGAHWHANFFDQALGPAVGGVVNDISAELAANAMTAQEAAELVKEAVDDTL